MSTFARMRPVIRQSRALGRRMASDTPSGSTNPQVQRAVEGAQKAYAQSAAAVGRVAGPIGQRVSGLLGGYREPLVYNSRVFLSLLRQVYQAERLAFPTSLSTWTHAYAQIYGRATNANYWQGLLRSGAWAGLGIVVIEAYGIFCLGEMIGRRNLVGYKLRD